MKKNQTNFINILGIGIFAYLVIDEGFGLFEFVLQNILIITKTTPQLILWVPSVLSLLLFIVTLVWSVNTYSRPIKMDTLKVLMILIFLLFVVLILQFLFGFYITDLLYHKFEEEFDMYHKVRSKNYTLQGYFAFIPILKYLLLGIVLLLKAKTTSENKIIE